MTNGLPPFQTRPPASVVARRSPGPVPLPDPRAASDASSGEFSTAPRPGGQAFAHPLPTHTGTASSGPHPSVFAAAPAPARTSAPDPIGDAAIKALQRLRELLTLSQISDGDSRTCINAIAHGLSTRYDEMSAAEVTDVLDAFESLQLHLIVRDLPDMPDAEQTDGVKDFGLLEAPALAQILDKLQAVLARAATGCTTDVQAIASEADPSTSVVGESPELNEAQKHRRDLLLAFKTCTRVNPSAQELLSAAATIRPWLKLIDDEAVRTSAEDACKALLGAGDASTDPDGCRQALMQASKQLVITQIAQHPPVPLTRENMDAAVRACFPEPRLPDGMSIAKSANQLARALRQWIPDALAAALMERHFPGQLSRRTRSATLAAERYVAGCFMRNQRPTQDEVINAVGVKRLAPLLANLVTRAYFGSITAMADPSARGRHLPELSVTDQARVLAYIEEQHVVSVERLTVLIDPQTRTSRDLHVRITRFLRSHEHLLDLEQGVFCLRQPMPIDSASPDDGVLEESPPPRVADPGAAVGGVSEQSNGALSVALDNGVLILSACEKLEASLVRKSDLVYLARAMQPVFAAIRCDDPATFARRDAHAQAREFNMQACVAQALGACEEIACLPEQKKTSAEYLARWKTILLEACMLLKGLITDEAPRLARRPADIADASSPVSFDPAQPFAETTGTGQVASPVRGGRQALGRLATALIDAPGIGYHDLRRLATQLSPELATLRAEDVPGHVNLLYNAMAACSEINRCPERAMPDTRQTLALRNLLLEACITVLAVRAMNTPKVLLTPSNIELAVRRCFPESRALEELSSVDAISRLSRALGRPLHRNFVNIVLHRFFGEEWELPKNVDVRAAAQAVKAYHEQHPDGSRPSIGVIRKTLKNKAGDTLIRDALDAYYGSAGATRDKRNPEVPTERMKQFATYLETRATRPLIDRARTIRQMQMECFATGSYRFTNELLAFVQSCSSVHPISMGLYLIGEFPKGESTPVSPAHDAASRASPDPAVARIDAFTRQQLRELTYDSPALSDLLARLEPDLAVVALGDSAIDRAAARAFKRLDCHELLGDLDLSVHLDWDQFEENMQALAAAFGVRRVDPPAVSTDRDVANLAAARTRDDGPRVKRRRGAEPQPLPQPQFTLLDPATSRYHDALRTLIGQAQQQMARQPRPLATGYAAPVSAATSAEVAASIATTAVALPVTPAFDTSRLVVQANPGGGSCLLHALAGATLTPDQIQGVRRAMAHELAQRPDTRGGPALNTMRLITALAQTAAGPALLRDLPAGLEMPNALYAECLALESHYLGYEDIALYCQLHDSAPQHARQPTPPLRVLVIAPSGELVHVTAAGEQTQRPRQPGEAEQAVQDALRRGDVVIHHSGDHFTRVLELR